MEQRTPRQNRSLHKYCELVARELQNMGFTMQDVAKRITMVEVVPTTYIVKEMIWKPIETAALGKNSTKDLTTDEVNKVYEIMSMFLSKQFGISLPFPSEIDLIDYEQ